MLDELPLKLEMPLGVSNNGDYTPFMSSFKIEVPYGLRTSGSSEPMLSHSLQVSTDPADPASRLHSVIHSRVRFLPATDAETSRLELQPLPIEQAQLGEHLSGSVIPNQIIYGNVEPSSVDDAIQELLASSGVSAGDLQRLLNKFKAGNLWITVKAGTFIGRPMIDSSLGGRRRVDLMMKDRNEFYLNPAHFLFQWPAINESLANHPLIVAMEHVQHRQIFAIKSRMILVRKNSLNPTSPYNTADTAARTIKDALVIASPGDIVVVMDNAVYAEKVSVPDGITLTSTAVLGRPGRVSENPIYFPTLNDSISTRAAVTFENLLNGPTHISGFIISGGQGVYGSGVEIINCYGVEVAQNDIFGNKAAFGGGINIIDSRRIVVSCNVIRNNDVTVSSFIDKQGQGGGIFVGGYSSDVTIIDNDIYRNTAMNFGGGIAVVYAKGVRIIGNNVGGPTQISGNIVTGEHLSYLSSIIQENPSGGGGGIGIFNTFIRADDNRIQNNQSHRGGGVEFYHFGGGILRRNEISENRTRPPNDFGGGDGGGIAVNNISIDRDEVDRQNRKVVLEDNQIEDNSADDDGGGIYGTAKAQIEVRGSTHRIRRNSAQNNGGGIRISFGSLLTVSGGEIQDNHANLSGGIGGGGAIALRDSLARIKGCIIQGNDVNNFGGGGIYAITTKEEGITFPGVPSYDDIRDTAYRFTKSELLLFNCIIKNNSANGDHGAGGGIYVVFDAYDIHISIDGTTLSPNTATHTDQQKARNVVIEDNSTIVIGSHITNDDDLPSLIPLNGYDHTFSP